MFKHSHLRPTLNKLANTITDWKYSRRTLEPAEKAPGLNPINNVALINKRWALIDLERTGEPTLYLIRATMANPRNEYAWFNLAWAHYLLGNLPTHLKRKSTSQLLALRYSYWH
jgi:hypothetical protein